MVRKLAFTTFLIFAFTLTTFGQTTNSSSAQKQALLKELIVAIDIKKVTEKTMESSFAQMENNFSQMMGPLFSNSASLTKEDQEKVKQKSLAAGMRAMKKFRERYSQSIDLGEIVEQIYLPIYDKYFSTEEIQDLLTFYRSTTGKKFVASTPQINQEAMQKSYELLMPKITQIMTGVMEEERAIIQKEIEAAFPPPPPPAPKAKTVNRKK